jgi:hypothetical protein
MNPIIKYFNGEKAESYLFIVLGVISLIMALYFIFTLKTSFWRGIAIPFICVAILEFVVGFTIVNRSPKDIARVENLKDNEPGKILTEEIPRMEKVMHNFMMFRYIEIALIICGIILMYSYTKDALWRGLGLGLFIQASMVLCLDFFAERRGYIYLKYLTELTDKT